MRVGVVLPVFGFAPFLTEALDAVLAQAGSLDVVVVDDGSPVPVALHPDHASRVTLVRRERSGGPAHARATGADELSGEVGLVALCDADDAWRPGLLAAAVGALERTREAGWAFGRAEVVGADGRPTGERWAEPSAGRLDARAFGAQLYAANPIPTSSVVVRREKVAAAGGFPGPVRVAEDWELWLRLCRIPVDAVCVPDAVVGYRRHPGGLTADVTALAAAQLALHEAHAGLVPGEVARRTVAADHAALAAGLAREGRYVEARTAWAQVAERRALRPGEQVRRLALSVPGVRGRMGRADPYRGR